jgi:hypothetical protein
MYENIHKYSIKVRVLDLSHSTCVSQSHSLQDLIDVNSGTFGDRLKKLVKLGAKHVKRCAVSPSR